MVPSAPANFIFDHFGYREYRLNIDGNNDADEHFEVRTDSLIFTWLPSTDNVGVDHYEIYFGDGELAASTTNTSVSVSNLNLNTSYNFYAEAVDVNGNHSSPSSLTAVTTTMSGLYYNLYAGGTWDYVREFSHWGLFDNGFGSIPNFDIYGAKSGKYEDNDYFGYEFFGYISIDNPGSYTFYTNSDDGSQLWIGAAEIVDNDGTHGGQWRQGSINLETGVYPITVKFFERSGGEGLTVQYEGPGVSRKDIPSSVLRSGVLHNATPPVTPTNLTATAHSTNFSIDLDWDYSPTNIVVLGSSTAAGYGLTGSELSWVEKLDSALTVNNANYTLTNLAQGGYNTYYLRANGSSGGGYTGAPDVNKNITEALSLNPDIIIVNMPSNNVADGIDVPTTISHYQEMKTLADAAGVEIFFTTTQPRDFSDLSKRDLLEDETNAVRQNFGQYVIDIYDELTDFGNNKARKSIYALSSDNIHLNVLGHQYIFTEVMNTVGPHIPKFEVYQSVGGGSYSIVHTTSYANNNYNATSLNPSTTYNYKVKAVNLFGSSSDSNVASATTVADTDPPTQPQNLIVMAKTSSKVALSWDNSSDNVGVSQYIITYSTEGSSESGSRKSGSNKTAKTQANSVYSNNNGVTIEDLASDTDYTFTVAALDASSNQSLESTPLSVQTESDGPLPVEFFDFTYIIKNGEVVLSWKTASENNNSRFEIERGSSVDSFKKIGELTGAGTSTEVLKYQFTDENPKTENYYRVKQVDFDGKSSYSNILKVGIEGDPFKELVLYPNPSSTDNINIRGRVKTDNDKVIIEFMDIVGKKQLSLETDNDSLVDGISINLSKQLKPGIYMVLISDGVRMSQKKLVIQ